MTQEEKQEVIRVCGSDFTEQDIPTYIRNREGKELRKITGHYKINSSYCTKCGEPILGDEPSLCARCI
jgi:hypothetical protein